MVAVEGDEQVIPHAVGNDAVRPDTGRKVGDLVIRAIDRLDMLCRACGFDVVLTDCVAGGIFESEVVLCHGFFLCFLFVVCTKAPAAGPRQALRLASCDAVR